jgi:hypothetical protein
MTWYCVDPRRSNPRQTNRGPWFHGDTDERTHFRDQRWDRDHNTRSPNVEGPGLYFTNDRSDAESYGGFLYEMNLHPSFKLMPRKKPTLAFLRTFWEMANEVDRELFLSNWGFENDTNPDQALKKYLGQDTMHNAAVALYGDMIRDPAEWVAAVRATGYDGVVIDRNTAWGHRNRKHLVIWSPEKMSINRAS